MVGLLWGQRRGAPPSGAAPATAAATRAASGNLEYLRHAGTTQPGLLSPPTPYPGTGDDPELSLIAWWAMSERLGESHCPWTKHPSGLSPTLFLCLVNVS